MKKLKRIYAVLITLCLMNSIVCPAYGMKRLHPGTSLGGSNIRGDEKSGEFSRAIIELEAKLSEEEIQTFFENAERFIKDKIIIGDAYTVWATGGKAKGDVKIEFKKEEEHFIKEILDELQVGDEQVPSGFNLVVIKKVDSLYDDRGNDYGAPIRVHLKGRAGSRPERRSIYIGEGDWQRLKKNPRALVEYMRHEKYHLDHPKLSEKAVERICPTKYVRQALRFAWAEEEFRRMIEEATIYFSDKSKPFLDSLANGELPLTKKNIKKAQKIIKKEFSKSASNLIIFSAEHIHRTTFLFGYPVNEDWYNKFVSIKNPPTFAITETEGVDKDFTLMSVQERERIAKLTEKLEWLNVLRETLGSEILQTVLGDAANKPYFLKENLIALEQEVQSAYNSRIWAGSGMAHEILDHSVEEPEKKELAKALKEIGFSLDSDWSKQAMAKEEYDELKELVENGIAHYAPVVKAETFGFATTALKGYLKGKALLVSSDIFFNSKGRLNPEIALSLKNSFFDELNEYSFSANPLFYIVAASEKDVDRMEELWKTQTKNNCNNFSKVIGPKEAEEIAKDSKNLRGITYYDIAKTQDWFSRIPEEQKMAVTRPYGNKKLLPSLLLWDNILRLTGEDPSENPAAYMMCYLDTLINNRVIPKSKKWEKIDQIRSDGFSAADFVIPVDAATYGERQLLERAAVALIGSV